MVAKHITKTFDSISLNSFVPNIKCSFSLYFGRVSYTRKFIFSKVHIPEISLYLVIQEIESS